MTRSRIACIPDMPASSSVLKAFIHGFGFEVEVQRLGQQRQAVDLLVQRVDHRHLVFGFRPRFRDYRIGDCIDGRQVRIAPQLATSVLKSAYCRLASSRFE